MLAPERRSHLHPYPRRDCEQRRESAMGRAIFRVSVLAPARYRRAQRPAHDQGAPAPPLTVAALARAREASRLLEALPGLAVVPVLPRVPYPLPRVLRALSPP